MRNKGYTFAICRSLAVLTLCFTGCASKSPGLHYYSLAPLIEVAAESKGDGLSVEVGPIKLPQALNREQIVTRSNANLVIVNTSHRWAAPLEKDLAAVMIQNLAGALGTARVAGFGQTPLGSADYRVLLDFQQFGGILGDSAILRSTWTIIAPGKKQVLAVRQSNLTESLTGDEVEALVAGLSRLLENLSREIALEISRLAGES
ncbi:lipoprotein [Desulfuromonas versatilis]|uniref:Lipoprotein n=1 Tax=Desulfuromonas versatilis TaxID=2802975 RepID=A0ABN6DYA9_9BACT|nr:PqiC family protein [Desulfuromonas versatilis]BCR05005.1 lipoprotein [Desulfuromonas versatilis]